MAEPRHLSKAPIVEAVIDMQVIAKVQPEQLGNLGAIIGYEPRGDELRNANIHIVNTSHSTSHETVLTGYKFHSKDQKYIVQFRVNGITFSRVPPYESWDVFFAECCRLWEEYCKAASVESVTRIAIRNINKLTFPLKVFVASPMRFLNAPPLLPVELVPSVAVNQWITRFLMQDATNTLSAFLTQVSDPDVTTGNLSIAIDVDAFCARSLPITMDELRPLFDKLRHFKNQLFFSSVTEETLQPFI